MSSDGRSTRTVPRALAGLAIAVGLSVNLPLIYLLVRAWSGGAERFGAAMITPSTLRLTLHTMTLVAGVVALALLIAGPLAWLVARSDLRGRTAWAVLGALPLVYPSYVSAFSLVAVLGPRGYLQQALQPLGIERLPDLAYGYSGALLALALYTYPYIFLVLVAAFAAVDPALEESSRILGVGRWRTFTRVTLPQLEPALLGGSLLVALYAVSDFGAVSIIRYNTLTLSIYNAYRSLFDRTQAAVLATQLVVLALVLIGAEAWRLRRIRPRPARATRPAPRVRLGRWQPLCQFALLAHVGLTLGMPTGVIVNWGVRAVANGNALGRFRDAALGSAATAAAAAVLAVLAALPVALWSVRYPSRAGRFIERVSHAGFALPGLVIALALVFFVSRHLQPLYQTLALLIAAYVIRFLPEALASSRAALLEVAPAYEEAGRALGRGPFAVWRTITLPLVRPGLLAGAGLVFLTSMKELPATLILRPIGFETLSTRVWSAASEGIYSAAALPALGLLVVSAPTVYFLTIRPALRERR